LLRVLTIFFFILSTALLVSVNSLYSQDEASIDLSSSEGAQDSDLKDLYSKKNELIKLNQKFVEFIKTGRSVFVPIFNDIESGEPIIVERAQKDLLEAISIYNTSVIDLSTKIFSVEGVNHTILNGSFGSKPERQNFPYIYIVPYGDHYLNRFSAFLEQIDVVLSYSPQLLVLNNAGASFMPSEKMLSISNNVVSSSYKDKSASIHELLHALFNKMERLGIESDFIGALTFPENSSSENSYGEPYSKYLSLEEIAAYTENVAYGTRAVHREYRKMMGSLTSSYLNIEKIVGDHVFDNLIHKTENLNEKKSYILKYNEILDLVKSIFITHTRSEKRHLKIEALLSELFNPNEEAFKNEVLSIVEELYTGKFNIYANDPSTLRNRKVFFSDLDREIGLQKSRLSFLMSVSGRIEKTLSAILLKIKEPEFYHEAGTSYYTDLYNQGYSEFDPSKPVRFIGHNSDIRISPVEISSDLTGRVYTEVTCQTGGYADPLSFRTVIAGSFSSQKELLDALVEKIQRQAKMAEYFFNRAKTLEELMTNNLVYQKAESFNILGEEKDLVFMLEVAEELRKNYIEKIGVNGEKWAEIIKESKELNKKTRSIEINHNNWQEIKYIDPNIRGDNIKKGIKSMIILAVGDAYSNTLTEGELVELFGNIVMSEYSQTGALSLIVKSVLSDPNFYDYLEDLQEINPEVKRIFLEVVKPGNLNITVANPNNRGLENPALQNRTIIPQQNPAIIKSYQNIRGRTLRTTRGIGR
jgi:hypothetical protein